MAAAGWFAMRGLELAVPGAALGWQVARLAGAIAVSLVVLAAAAQLLRVREFEEVRDAVIAGFAGGAEEPPDARYVGRSFSSAEARVSGR